MKIRMNFKFCRIIRRELGFILLVHRFLQRENLFNFTKFEHRILIVGRYWWENSPAVGCTLVSGNSELLLLRTLFKERFCRVATCCFYTISSYSYLLYMDNLSVFGQSYKDFLIWDSFSFFRDLGQVLTLICFSVFLQKYFSRQPIALSRDSVQLK